MTMMMMLMLKLTWKIVVSDPNQKVLIYFKNVNQKSLVTYTDTGLIH